MKGVNAIVPKNPQEALTDELSRLSARKDEQSQKGSSAVGRQFSPLTRDPVQSAAGPTSARVDSRNENVGGETRSIINSRSSLNASTTIPMSARSVSFKEPIIDEVYDPPSSQTYQTTTLAAMNRDSALEKLVLPPPEEYKHNFNELERQNQSLHVEVEQLRSTNQNLQKQYEQVLDRLQTSQNLTKQEFNELLRQSGYNQTKDLENLNNTLQNRCDQLQDDLKTTRERYAQNQSQAYLQELKTENVFLKDYVHRLNAASSEYQTLNPPKSLEKEIKKEQRQMEGLPNKGPQPSWLLHRKFLAPLFLCYDEKIRNQTNFIKKIRHELEELKNELRSVTDENIRLHQRLSQSTVNTTNSGAAAPLSDLNQIKRQAYLVLEENEVLRQQRNLETDRSTDLQKNQIQEVSTLTRRLMLIENEKTETDRMLETFRIRNEDLRRKYEQLMMDNNHRIHIQEHVHEISEMKRLTDELSEKHAHEMQLLLRRLQDSEATKKVAQLKLTDCRTEVERFKGELRTLKKTNKKLQLRVQTFEKKVELEQVKKRTLNNQLENTTDEFEQMKLERDTYLALVKTNEDELNQIRNLMKSDQEKLSQLEDRLENYKSKNRNRPDDNAEQTQKQHDNVKLRTLEYEQRIQQLMSLLNEKETTINELKSEKRNLQVDLETIWQASTADNMRMREHLLNIRTAS